MTRFIKAPRQIPGMIITSIQRRQVSAVFLMLAMLMPVTVPIPAWAQSLQLPVYKDDGLRLTAPGSSLADSARNLAAKLMSGPAFFAASGSDKEPKEAAYNIAELEKRVAGIETELKNGEEVKVGQLISLAALPVDKKGQVVNGIATKWQCSDSKVVRILNDSQAVAVGAGEARLVAYSGNTVNEINVTVTKQPGNENSMPVDEQLELAVLSVQEVQNLVTPENNLGNPVGQTEMSSPSVAAATRTRERYGSSNYSFSIPAASLPGRGIDASVGITYNSRVWNKSQVGESRTFTYNTDGNWLAPGFETGFGDITSFGASYGASVSGYMLSSPDGTRHQLIYKQASGSCSIYESTDGTFIQTTICGNYQTSTMNVVFPDGSQVMYGAWTTSGKRFPVRITDSNGNMLTIVYIANDNQGKIDYIRDTLNRYIKFYYETGTSDKKLVAITVPGYEGSGERQTIRFYYEPLTLQTAGRFDSEAQVNAPTTPINVLRFVYFPGTDSGYKYEYSPYFGTIYKISQRRGMQKNSDSLTETGSIINEGTEAASTHYNYAATAMETGPPLTDVPKYTWRKDDWQGRTTAIPQTSFFNDESVTPAGCQVSQGTCTGTRTVNVTAPDGTRSISVSKIRPTGDWENGLLDQTRLETGGTGQETIWSKTKLYWEQGPDSQMAGRDNPRLNKIEITNDAGQIRATSFGYDGYNNQTLVIEHDFAAENVLGTEGRRTETAYENGVDWVGNRLLRLPKEIKTIVGGLPVSKVIYEYDKNGESAETALTPRTDISTDVHDRRYNPATPPGEVCRRCDEEDICCWEIPVYQHKTRFRGNVTKITAFSDATLASDPNAVVSTVKYDITGNVVESSSSCCELKTTQYSNDNHYAYPMSETRNGGGLQMTTSATYDKNTGLVKTAKDENLQETILTYNPANLRLIRTDSPNGAWQTVEYNDAAYPYHVKTTSSLDASRSVSSWSFSNGRGQGFRSRSQTAGGYLSSDVEFDIMGRAVKSLNPYTVAGLTDARPGDVKFSEVVTRDGLGRTLQSRLPDMTLVNASYSGLVATATDQAGKSRRQIADALGRTVRVDEPDASGNLGAVTSPVQPTYYEYDGNDNLTKVTQTQGSVTQERVFVYDSLSRLRRERQVEASPTLNTNGVHQGGSAPDRWTGVYNYNTDSLLTEGFDARGVKTTVGYDGLKRAKTVVYTGETTYITPNVEYTYDEAETGFYNNGRLTRAKTLLNSAQGTPETTQNYDYDKVGQVTKHIQSIGNQTYSLEYGYNLAGQLISEKYPSGKVVNMTVDNFGRLSAVADSQRTYLSSISFNNQGLLSQINLGNGTNETFSYNDRFQMTSQSLMKGAEVVQKYDYSYGEVDVATGDVLASKNNGQLGKIEGWIGANKQWSQRFKYDELGRLKEAREYKQGDNAQLTYKQVFDFDRFGNLYRKAANNPTAGQQNPLAYTPIEDAEISKTTNRFTSGTGTTYDDAGQVVTDNKFRTMNFAYDANGRQVKSTRTGVPDAWTVYDALGNRVATKINDIWQYVIYDAFGKLVAEYGVPGPGLGGVNYVQQDWQGSVRTVTNNSGFVVSRTDHEAFGEEIGQGIGLRTSAQGYTAPSSPRQGYGLTEKDDTGLNHTWFRKNENLAGRWTSPDPYKGSMSLGNPQSFNRYSYVENQPTNFVDPSGLFIYIGPRTPSIDSGWLRFLLDSLEFNRRPRDGDDDGGIGGIGGGGIGPPSTQPPSDVCDISDLAIPAGVSIARNVGIALERFGTVQKAHLIGAAVGGVGGALTFGGGAASAHANWFYKQVDTNGPWDYKQLDKVGDPKTGKSIYEPFGNFHFGVVGMAAGFGGANTLQRMAGYIQEQNKQKSDGGEHGGLASIIKDFVLGRSAGQYPYKDEMADQTLIERGIAYYNGGCYK